MVYIKDIPNMGYTCRAYLICTLRKKFAVIAYLLIYMLLIASHSKLHPSVFLSLVMKIYIKNPPARSIPHILTRKTLQLYVSTI